MLAGNRGGRGRGGFSHRGLDRKIRNGGGPHRPPAPGPQLFTPNPFGYPGPPQNQHPHPPANPPAFYNPAYQQGYGQPPQAHHPFNPHYPAAQPLANQSQNSGRPWQGFEWEALSGPYGPFSRERYSQPLPQVDTLPHLHHTLPVNEARDPSCFKASTRQPHLDSLYEDDIHLDYMDCDSNSDPRGLPHNNTNTQTQTQASRPQAQDIKPSTLKNIPSTKLSPPFKADPSISSNPPLSNTERQPIDRVMVLQQRPDAPRLSSVGSSTTPNNNNLYNRQLDFTPSLLSHPPTAYVLDATFWKIEARDAARKADAMHVERTTTNNPKVPSVVLVASNQQPARVSENGHKENSGSQKTLRPHAGFLRSSQPTAEEKRKPPSKLRNTTIEPGPTVDVTLKKTSRLSGPPLHAVRKTRATTSENGMPLDGVKVADRCRVMDTEVHESEKWGGGRLIPSGLNVARRKNEDNGLRTTKLLSRRVSDNPPEPTADVPETAASNGPQLEEARKLVLSCTSIPAATLSPPQKSTSAQFPATKSLAKLGASRRRRPPGAKGQWKGYALAGDRPQMSEGKLLLLDAPPVLLPERSTRSGKVFKPPTDGSSSEQASDNDDSEEERKVNRRRRPARKSILSSEHSDE